jgi:hypothetical protein
MSYQGRLSDARADIKMVESDNEANMATSPVLRGQSNGGPESKGTLAPKTFVLGKHETTPKREL